MATGRTRLRLIVALLVSAAVATSTAATTLHEDFNLIASDAAEGDRFGNAVAITDQTLVVGARSVDDSASTDAGAVYVFERSDAGWQEEAKLTASDPAIGDRFGFAVAVSEQTMLVGASFADVDGLNNAGAAYVFTRESDWSEQAKLTADDPGGTNRFGFSVALSGDTAVVGAFRDDQAGEDAGSAYVFVRDGGVWSQQAKLTASTPVNNGLFGSGVALSENTLLVGSSGDGGTPFLPDLVGAGFVFTREGSIWTQRDKLVPADSVSGDRVGWSVALSGSRALLGTFAVTHSVLGDNWLQSSLRTVRAPVRRAVVNRGQQTRGTDQQCGS